MMLGPQFSLNSANSARHEDFVQMVEHVCTLVLGSGGSHSKFFVFQAVFELLVVCGGIGFEFAIGLTLSVPGFLYFHIIRMISIVLGALK